MLAWLKRRFTVTIVEYREPVVKVKIGPTEASVKGTTYPLTQAFLDRLATFREALAEVETEFDREVERAQEAKRLKRSKLQAAFEEALKNGNA